MSRPTGTAMMEKLVSLCKRRGFVFPASEIYGGINGFWDYGPLGVSLKNKGKEQRSGSPEKNNNQPNEKEAGST